MARKSTDDVMGEEPSAAPAPCPICGGTPGYNTSTGVELKQGHYSSCPEWRQA